MSPNLEQPQDSPSPSSETSEAGVGVPCPDPRQEQPWPRQTRPKSSPGGRLGRRGSAGWEEALVVADVEEEEVGAVDGVGWGQEAHSWGQDAAHTGVRGAHDDADDDEAGWAEGGPVATVKLVLETGVGVITRAWALNQPLHALRTQLSHTTQVPAQYVQLVLRGRMLGDEATLRGVGVEANETVQVGVSSKRPHTHPLTLLAPTSPPLPTPDVITVIVAEGGGVEREVVVEVEWASGPKVWLGGFRHKLSGLHYHNAATQTLATTRPAPGKVTRGSQTVWARTRGTQTRRHAHTQTTALHPLLVTPTPTIITPRPYVPARHYDLAKVVMVQKIVRGFLGRRRATRMARVRQAAASCTRRVSEAGSDEQRLAVTVSSPSTEEDLDSDQQRREWLVPLTQLYARLENWRRRQVALVTETLTGRERRAALVALLDKETELLRALEAHRGIRTARRRNAAVAHFLQEVCGAASGVGGEWTCGRRGGGDARHSPHQDSGGTSDVTHAGRHARSSRPPPAHPHCHGRQSPGRAGCWAGRAACGGGPTEAGRAWHLPPGAGNFRRTTQRTKETIARPHSYLPTGSPESRASCGYTQDGKGGGGQASTPAHPPLLTLRQGKTQQQASLVRPGGAGSENLRCQVKSSLLGRPGTNIR